jgi:hypothetical protein
MIRTAREIEREHVARFKEQQREATLRRFANPDLDPALESVWVVFAWHPAGDDVTVGEWKLAGFRPRKRRRKPQSMGRFFARVRRKLNIDKKTPVRVMDLRMARQFLSNPAEHAWLERPPRYQRRKPKMEQRMPKPIGKRTKRRATQKAYLLNKRGTRYIAIGRNTWDRAKGYLYLGPLRSEKKRQAQFEAKRMFNVYSDILVLDTEELSKPLRNAMARGKRVRAGVTRIQWPEIPLGFDDVYGKFIKRTIKRDMHGLIDAEDPRWQTVGAALHSEWTAQDKPWLSLSWFRKQIKPWRIECAPKQNGKKKKRAIVGSRKASGPSSRTKKTSRVRKSASKYAVLSKRSSRNSAPKRRRNSTTQKRTSQAKRAATVHSSSLFRTKSTPKQSLRSIASRVMYAIRSVRATKTKDGRTRIGLRKARTNTRSALVVRATLTQCPARTMIRKRASTKSSTRRKTSASRKTSATR